MSSFRDFASKYRALSDTGFLVMHKLTGLIESVARNIDDDAIVQARFKTASSTWCKMNLLGLAIDEVDDLIGVRVIFDEVTHCYALVEELHRRWPEWSLRVENYVANPKPNGYQSVHVHVSCGQGLRFEVQVRTRAMHWASEQGEAAHWKYKLDEATERAAGSTSSRA